MAGVGQQRHGVGEEAIDRLDQHESHVQRNADGESLAETGRRMDMAGSVMAGSVMVVAVTMTIMSVMIMACIIVTMIMMMVVVRVLG
jgi:uncharacterized membrane protein